MKSEQEIRDKIKETEKSYNHVLTGTLATVFENAPRAIMQVAAVEHLNALYFCIDEKRPQYEFENRKQHL